VSSVQLRLGDMFDGPSDLIVLPCSTGGTITSFVKERLSQLSIPNPKVGMELGEVQLLPFEGGENIAQFVAFAASVRGYSTEPDAIRRIGTQLGQYTKEVPSIRLVAAPLLGAGAGGLRGETVIDSLKEGFKSSSHPDAALVISILNRNAFDRMGGRSGPAVIRSIRQDNSEGSLQKPIRVFISYCHTSPDHKQWVLSLGTFLRQNGVEARLDVWHLRHGMDLPQFMTNELTLADRVILISDEKYAEKADGRIGGVGWETMIVQGDMSRQPPDSTKYLVIVKSSDLNAGLPIYLRTKLVMHWPDTHADDKHRRVLLKEVYNYVEIPPIGPSPVFL
jgi:hypothetical protein